MSDSPQIRLDTAWQAWIDGQQAAIETVRTAQEVPRLDVDWAEGYRWVTRLASLAQEWFIEKSDPLHPQLFQSQTEYRKLLVDNPDVRYGFCALDDQKSYRLHGTRGKAAYIGLTFGTPFGKGSVGGRTGTTAQAHLDEFELGAERGGRHPDRPARPDAGAATEELGHPGAGHRRRWRCRETFFDRWKDTPSDLKIELSRDGPVTDPGRRGDRSQASSSLDCSSSSSRRRR